MINCSICKFEVSNKMRHALTRNMCPACGAALLGDFHMQRLNMIREKVSAQDFSKGLDQSVLFDMSLFIMSEFFSSNPNRAATISLKDLNESSNDEDDLVKIREQVRRDALAASKNKFIKDIDTSFDDTVEDSFKSEEDLSDDSEESDLEDLEIPEPKTEQDLKVAKLKRLYNESPTLSKSGVSVRRVT